MIQSIRKVLAYIHNRWVCPSDRVIIKHPDYPQGHYHDADCRMLYLLFQMIVDFVEIECGSSWGPYCFETPIQKTYRIIQDLPLLTWLLPPGRNARRGLHHLRWAMKLTDMPSQAQQARDVFTLYRFWKHERPKRKDPFEDAELYREKGSKLSDRLTTRYKAFLDRAGEIEDNYDREDEQMLHLLMKIRTGLWT